MTFVVAIAALLSLGWAAPNAARAMIPRETPASILAARMDGPNAIVQRTRGRLYLPKADESVERDAAGRVTLDSRWEYKWNLRGELIQAESKHRSPNVRLDYAYYPSGPMARREKREWVNGEWRLVSTTTWTVDGWRPVNEFEQRADGTNTERWYTWGLDLAGWRDRRALDASSGIGGLLAVRERVNAGDWATYYVLSDPMGNVMALATADGTLVAEYDYDPYGRLIRETGPNAGSCPFRYSTKYRDPDLELYYYGYRWRWYDAAAMKWLTPDPIGERGGANLTAFCDGDPINQVDPLGLQALIHGNLPAPVRYGASGPPSHSLSALVAKSMAIQKRGELEAFLAFMNQPPTVVKASMGHGRPSRVWDPYQSEFMLEAQARASELLRRYDAGGWWPADPRAREEAEIRSDVAFVRDVQDFFMRYGRMPAPRSDDLDMRRLEMLRSLPLISRDGQLEFDFMQSLNNPIYVLYKSSEFSPQMLRPGEYTLNLPPLRGNRMRDEQAEALHWEQNLLALQRAMRIGNPIREANPFAIGGFLQRERDYLILQHWQRAKFGEDYYWVKPSGQ